MAIELKCIIETNLIRVMNTVYAVTFTLTVILKVIHRQQDGTLVGMVGVGFIHLSCV